MKRCVRFTQTTKTVVNPNNDPASDERFAQAHAAIQKAVYLSANASPAEQAYIRAMALRFPADPKASPVP